MKIVFLHPTGNANVRAAAYGLAKSSLLYRFHTAIACFSGGLLAYLSRFRLFSEIRRRSFDEALKPFTKMSPSREIGRLIFSRLGITKFLKHEKGIFCIDSVYRNLDKRVALGLRNAKKNGAKAVYAYEDGAALTFRESRRLGLFCFYDLPTGYWRASRDLLDNEQKRWPQWAMTFTGFQDSDEKLARKDEELQLADCIFVASQFTAETLKSYPGKLKSIQIIPYGFPDVENDKEYRTFSESTQLKLLFVGKLSQQKGIADLFAAIQIFGDKVQLTIVGQKANDDCPALNVELAKHTWFPSLPHESVIKIMREHDVLVFPSLFDGFGLVITEAMAQGTPVIATERTAGPSLIEHGVNGWLVKAGSTDELKTTIGHLLQFPEQISQVGKRAMETAKLRPWAVYSTELNDAILKHIVKSKSI